LTKVEHSGVAAVETPYAPTQEVRFALVLYGGVSLAIYINGVVQEFLHLVRATAPKAPPPASETALLTEEQLKSTEMVYRRLGQLAVYGEQVEAGNTSPGDPILTRFVVDILSGSSAGGINGIFLAKALAHELEIDELSTLWVEEGGIEDLLNDERSILGVPDDLQLVKPPISLLNSRRMYWQILNALDGMGGDDSEAAASDSRLVDELDLWVTMTDIRGLELPVDLMDCVVFENKYKALLHFRYATPYAAGVEQTRSDFRRRFNPLLAFAGRATASFPYAFDPMLLKDVDWAVEVPQFQGRYQGGGSANVDWVPFFDEIVRGRSARAPTLPRPDLYRFESFGDGGYLDNKPFTWATATLSRRRADLPVDRRLIYIEPDPGGPPPQFRDEPPSSPRPWEPSSARVGVIPNVIAAAHKLPRAETIREDLERLLERNREIARIRGIADLVDELDVTDPVTADEWRVKSHQELPGGQDPRYAAYHRLKIDVALDALSDLVSRVVGVEADSEYASALRCVVQAWFDATYSEAPSGVPGLTEAEFLLRFDAPYRLRRLNYLDGRIQRLLRFDDRSLMFLTSFADDATLAEVARLKPELDAALRNAKRRLSEVFVQLRGELARLVRDHELQTLFRGVGLEPADLTAILAGARGQDESIHRAAQMLRERDLMAQLDAAALKVANKVEKPLIEAADGITAALEATNEGVDPRAREIVSVGLRQVREHYEDYDSVLLPMGYRVVDEADPVEVIRISPQDADSLIDENDPVGPNEKRRTKLAGVAIHHFGGFFEEGWRKNDILWGRLDAAERIIETVLSAGTAEVRDARDELLRRAQREIIREEFAGRHGRLVRAYLPDGLLPPTPPGEDDLPPLTDDEADAVRGYLATDYQVPATLDPGQTDKLIGRATRVSRDMFLGVAGTSFWPRLGVRTAATAARAYFGYKKVRRRASAVGDGTKRASRGIVRRIRNLPGIRRISS
jgi:patatin-related protein